MSLPLSLVTTSGLSLALSPERLRYAAIPAAEPAPRRQRAKLWELHGSFHCSIIGTCLTTAELRRVMGKVSSESVTVLSDHDLHSRAVGLCGQHSPAAKLLHKALDHRHELTIKRLGKLSGEAAVMAAWDDYRRAGDIPGAYWAVLTHPDTEASGLRRAFGDVHMLSHLVGAANRADIQRLTALEQENAELREKVERQHTRLQEMRTGHETALRQLTEAVASRVVSSPVRNEDDALSGLRRLTEELQARLTQESARRTRLEQRLQEALAAQTDAVRHADDALARAEAAEREIAILEANGFGSGSTVKLPAQRVLYVGGRPAVVAAARALIEGAGGVLLSHDGGRHDHVSLLPGYINQCDLIAFPVDCVSHDAVITVKRICRQQAKPYRPLRTSGLTSFIAALADTPLALET